MYNPRILTSSHALSPKGKHPNPDELLNHFGSPSEEAFCQALQEPLRWSIDSEPGGWTRFSHPNGAHVWQRGPCLFAPRRLQGPPKTYPVQGWGPAPLETMELHDWQRCLSWSFGPRLAQTIRYITMVLAQVYPKSVGLFDLDLSWETGMFNATNDGPSFLCNHVSLKAALYKALQPQSIVARSPQAGDASLGFLGKPDLLRFSFPTSAHERLRLSLAAQAAGLPKALDEAGAAEALMGHFSKL